MTKSLLSTMGALLVVSGCAARQCPVAAGAEVPYQQLLSQTEQFEQCRVKVRAFFAQTGLPPGAGAFLKVPDNQTAFKIGPPDQQNMTYTSTVNGQQYTSTTNVPQAAAAMNGITAVIPNDKSSPLFTMKAGTPIVLYGIIELRKQAFVGDMGNMSRLFHADQIEIDSSGTK